MGITIDGSANYGSSVNTSTQTKKKLPDNLHPVWTPLFLVGFLFFIGVFVYLIFFADDGSKTRQSHSINDFVEDFFLSETSYGSTACRSIDLTSSYDSCVAYYNDEFTNEYSGVSFEYTYEVISDKKGVLEVEVTLSNQTSDGGNFNYSKINFSLVKVENQDRYIGYNSYNGIIVKSAWHTDYEVLFQTLEFK